MNPIGILNKNVLRVNLKFSWLFLLLAVLGVSGAVALQKPPKPFHVILVVAGGAATLPPQITGLNDGLRELGYRKGENLIIKLLQRKGYRELRDSLRGLSKKDVDALITTSSAETVLAKEATNEIPIVFSPAADPVGLGLVKSLARPGTNLTGLSFFRDSEESGKQLEVFKRVVPELRRVVVLYDKRRESLPPAATLKIISTVAEQLAIQLIHSPVRSTWEAEQVISSTPIGAADGIFLLCSPTFRIFKNLASLALEKRLPIFGCNASQVAHDGALLTYAPDMYYLGYRAARYLDRVLKGAKPQDLAVETPMKFDLVINLRVAKHLGITIPPQALTLADKVIS